MRILFLGDVVGNSGCSKIMSNLLEQIKLNKIDFVIVNGENAAEAGVGLTKDICEDFFKCGVNVITTGNHVWDQKEIMSYIEKENRLLRPKNLIEQEVSLMTKNLKPEEKEKHKLNNEKLAKSRIKLGLILNEFGEKNNLKVSDDEVRAEIQKQIKGMPGQEKMVLDYYQKNPSASQSLRGSLYEEKIIELIKSKIKLNVKEIDTKEAEKIISEFNKPNIDNQLSQKTKSSNKDNPNTKKISKK